MKQAINILIFLFMLFAMSAFAQVGTISVSDNPLTGEVVQFDGTNWICVPGPVPDGNGIYGGSGTLQTGITTVTANANQLRINAGTFATGTRNPLKVIGSASGTGIINALEIENTSTGQITNIRQTQTATVMQSNTQDLSFIAGFGKQVSLSNGLNVAALKPNGAFSFGTGFSNASPTAPTDGDMWYDSGIDSIRVTTTSGTKTIPYREDVFKDTMYTTTASQAINLATNTNLTGLTHAFVAGEKFTYTAYIIFDVPNTTIGFRPAVNAIGANYFAEMSAPSAASTFQQQAVYNSNGQLLSSSSRQLTGNVAVIKGSVTATANGGIFMQGATEIGGQIITIQPGSQLIINYIQ